MASREARGPVASGPRCLALLRCPRSMAAAPPAAGTSAESRMRRRGAEAAATPSPKGVGGLLELPNHLQVAAGQEDGRETAVLVNPPHGLFLGSPWSGCMLVSSTRFHDWAGLPDLAGDRPTTGPQWPPRQFIRAGVPLVSVDNHHHTGGGTGWWARYGAIWAPQSRGDCHPLPAAASHCERPTAERTAWLPAVLEMRVRWHR